MKVPCPISRTTDVNSSALDGRNHYLVFWDAIKHRHSNAQMLIHQQVRRMCHPLRRRDVLVFTGFEHLEKNQVGVARILDVVRVGNRDVSDIRCSKSIVRAVEPTAKTVMPPCQ